MSAIAGPVEYSDLIGLAWREGARGPSQYDCGGVVEEILRRLGTPAPPLPAGKDRDPIQAAEEYGGAWDFLGPNPLCASRVGDVILSDPAQEGRAVHLSIVVRRSPRVVISSYLGHGVARAPVISEAETVGAYRLKSQRDKMQP